LNVSDWVAGDSEQAKILADNEQIRNTAAPRMVRRRAIAPKRETKAVYIQKKYSDGLDRVVFEQKVATGKKRAPELAEEAIALLCEKYNVEL
jgi:hypothetical protein